MPEAPHPNDDRRTELEVWLESLTNLGKQLVAPPPRVEEKTPAGEGR